MCKCGENGKSFQPNLCDCKPKLDLTKPVQTVDGKKVTILGMGRGNWPIKGYIGDANTLTAWSSTGKCVWGGDLVNVPVTVKKVLYLHRQDIDRNHYVSESNYGGMSIASKEVEFTIGEFVK